MGYHKAKIEPGEYGEFSKILEEADEFADAIDQGITLMALMELSDLVGAITGYLAKHHPSITLDDLIAMSEATKRAFESGERGGSAA
jgi:NTP pyrophosphatase (non-canonical NTP hydrolase)